MALELKTFSYRGNSVGPHLLITAGVHGDEFEPMLAVRRLVQLFGVDDPAIAGFRGRVTLVPVVNQSAFLRGHRCGDDGLDLARSCPGIPCGSVTEQTAWALSQLIGSADFYIDLHTGGTEFSVYPLAGYTLHPTPDVLDVQRRMARAFNLPVIWGTTPTLQGRSLSIARDASVPAIYCEYLGGGKCDPAGVDAYVAGCLNVMGEVNMIDRSRPDELVQTIIEDRLPVQGTCRSAILRQRRDCLRRWWLLAVGSMPVT